MLVAVAVDGFRTFRKVSPYLGCRGQILQRTAERLDRQPVVIAALANGRKRLLPGDIAAPRHAAIILREMDVDDVLAIARIGADRVGLLDIGMESVVHRL